MSMVYAPTMPPNLLTHTETHAFKCFLSSMEYSDSTQAPEWSMYGNVEDLSELIIPHTGQDNLRGAAKSLMSLDAVKWGNPPPKIPTQAHAHPAFPYQVHSNNHNNNNISNTGIPLAIAPLRTVSSASPPNADDVPSTSSSPASVAMSASPSTPFEFFQSHPPQLQSHQSAHAPSPMKRQSQDDSHAQSNKRPRPAPSQGHASTSSLHKIKPSQSSQSSRSLHSHQSPTSPASAPTPTGSSSLHGLNSAGPSQGHLGGAGSAGGPVQKPALLSSSQKKANHIQSEQKRRANIRRGYEALCEAVPALREAIALEDAQGPPQAQVEERKGGSAGGKGKGKGKAGDDADKEKMDGRAGPRSENVVLQKTIDHIQDLLQDKSDLLARLHNARAHLPHHQQSQNQNQWGMGAGTGEMPLWERAWTGGVGAGEDDDEEDD